MNPYLLVKLMAFLLFNYYMISNIHAQRNDNILTVTEQIFELSFIWQEVNYNFAHFDKVSHLHWDSTYFDYLKEIKDEKTNLEHVRFLQKFMAELNEGHTRAVPLRNNLLKTIGVLPLKLRPLEGQAVVVNISRQLADEIPIGSVIKSINHIEVDDYLKTFVFPFLSGSTKQGKFHEAMHGRGEPGVSLINFPLDQNVVLEFEYPSQDPIVVTIPSMPLHTSIDWVNRNLSNESPLVVEWISDDILYINLKTFSNNAIVDSFLSILPKLDMARGVIFDVRQNRGGNSANAEAITKCFIDEPLGIGTWFSRENIGAFRAWGRYRGNEEFSDYFTGKSMRQKTFEPIMPSEEFTYQGPVCILQNGNTYSAAEDFLSMMSLLPNVTLIGEPSAGSTGETLIHQLPYSKAFIGITAKRDVRPDGSELVGQGILPDIEIYQRINAFRKGEDLQLNEAISEIDNK